MFYLVDSETDSGKLPDQLPLFGVMVWKLLNLVRVPIESLVNAHISNTGCGCLSATAAGRRAGAARSWGQSGLG